VLVQISTEEVYREFPGRAVPADIHGMLMRVACLKDTLARKNSHLAGPGTTRQQAAEGFAGRHASRRSASEAPEIIAGRFGS
jgi:hypothetical protein